MQFFYCLYFVPVSDYYGSDFLFWMLKSSVCVCVCINSMPLCIQICSLNVISDHRWWFFFGVMQFEIKTEYIQHEQFYQHTVTTSKLSHSFDSSLTLLLQYMFTMNVLLFYCICSFSLNVIKLLYKFYKCTAVVSMKVHFVIIFYTFGTMSEQFLNVCFLQLEI